MGSPLSRDRCGQCLLPREPRPPTYPILHAVAGKGQNTAMAVGRAWLLPRFVLEAPLSIREDDLPLFTVIPRDAHRVIGPGSD